MTGTVKLSLFCPAMAITRVGFKHYLTALEDMELTATLPSGIVLPMFVVVIPPTPVLVHLLTFPIIANVSPCIGSGTSSDGSASLVTSLPTEPVAMEDAKGELVIVAKQIIAPTTFGYQGQFAKGSVTYPDCPTDLFGGGASSLMALGTAIF